MTPSLDRAVEAIATELCRLNGCTEKCDFHLRWALRIAALPHISPGVGELLSGLKRFDARIVGGCECCGTWVEYEEEKTGEVVMWRDILAIIDNKQETDRD